MKMEKFFVRVATHKIKMGEYISTDWIVFIYVCQYQHNFYTNTTHTIFDMLWLAFKADTNYNNFKEGKKGNPNTTINIMHSACY